MEPLVYYQLVSSHHTRERSLQRDLKGVFSFCSFCARELCEHVLHGYVRDMQQLSAIPGSVHADQVFSYLTEFARKRNLPGRWGCEAASLRMTASCLLKMVFGNHGNCSIITMDQFFARIKSSKP